MAVKMVPNKDLCNIPEHLIDQCREVWRADRSLPRHTADCNNVDCDVSMEKTSQGWRWRYMNSPPTPAQDAFLTWPCADKFIRNNFCETFVIFDENEIAMREVHLCWRRRMRRNPIDGISHYMNYLSKDADPTVKNFYTTVVLRH